MGTDPRCATCGKPRSNHPYRHPFVGPSKEDTIASLTADLAVAEAKLAQALYVLGGVRGAIKTGRNEPLVIWAEQIDIALTTIKPGGETDDKA